MADEKGIKELSELLDGLTEVAPAVIKVIVGLKDGFDAVDVANLLDLSTKAPAALAAVDGISEVAAEAKELNVDEAKVVVEKLYALSAALKAAKDQLG